MKRCLRSLVALIALTLAATAGAAAPSAELRGFACQTSRDPSSRQVSITAVMRPRAGTQHMELKFELLRKTDGGRFQKVRGRGLETWLRPSPPDLGQRAGDMWTYAKPVLSLAAPAVYRFRVIFRWELASTHTDAALYSPSCTQT